MKQAMPVTLLLITSTFHLLWQGSACVEMMALDDLRVCKTFPGLSKRQLELCSRQPDVTAAAIRGLHDAIAECQFQFRWHRWNCSTLTTKSRNPHTSTHHATKGYRESAFSSAIAAAGVAASVARACSSGRLLACGCQARTRSSAVGSAAATAAAEKTSPATRWKWGGCSHNLQYGIEFSKKFLDAREKGAGDIQSRVNLHNTDFGRLAVATNMQVRCKCHGVSGSCELKTCWKAAPDFRQVGTVLKEKFRSAVLVDQSNLGNGSPLLLRDSKRRRPRWRRLKKRPKKRRRDMSLELFYYQRSPNFCERDATLDIAGTVGRQCNRTSRGVDGCASLCCGRGYNMVRQKRTERCDCTFHWCCYVKCRNCTTIHWISVCK
nr:Wnt10 [Laodelphax striatellus]